MGMRGKEPVRNYIEMRMKKNGNIKAISEDRLYEYKGYTSNTRKLDVPDDFSCTLIRAYILAK